MTEFLDFPTKIAHEKKEQFIPDEACPFALSDIPNADPQELIYYINEKGHNWLMIAAAHGWTQSTRKLLKIGFDPNSCIESTSAMSLAYDVRHLDTVLVLLTNNAKFPENFNTDDLNHENLTQFTQTMVKFHAHVADGDTKAIEELACAYPDLRHFYNPDNNKSAALVALELRQVDVYEMLARHYILPASDEDVKSTFKALESKNVEKIKNLHQSLSLPDPESFLSALATRCFLGIGIDCNERMQRNFRLKTALDQLNYIPQCNLLLRFMEHTHKLRIVFDFTRDHWEVKDHSGKANFHPTKHIYVSAKKMLSTLIDQQNDICGVLIRDICAYAIQLRYGNGGKPYDSSDWDAKKEYKTAFDLCKVNKDQEKIVKKVFEENTDEDELEAILITCVPQLLVHYFKEPAELSNIKDHFEWIFIFFNSHVKKDLTATIPEMDALVMKRKKSFIEIVSNMFWTRKRTKIAAIGSVVVAALLLSFIVAFNRHGGESKRSNCGFVKAPNTAGFITGTEVADSYHGQWPWLAPLFIVTPGTAPDSMYYICGTSIITRFHLLTAAHCVSIPNMTLTYKNFFALVGGHDLSDMDIGNLHNMSRLFVHPSYEKTSRTFRSLGDIAILRTSERVTFTEYVQPICFPNPGVNVINVTGMVPGYGRFSTEQAHELMPKYTHLTTISAEKCVFERKAYSEIVSRKSFCAGMSKASPCAGDSGGGFYVRDPRKRQYTITGVVSQGLNANECHPEDFVVFVNVLDFVDWIAKKVTVCENGDECVKACELSPCRRKETCKDLPNGTFTCK